MTLRRSQRSTKTPAMRPTTRLGMAVAISVTPTRNAEPVRLVDVDAGGEVRERRAGGRDELGQPHQDEVGLPEHRGRRDPCRHRAGFTHRPIPDTPGSSEAPSILPVPIHAPRRCGSTLDRIPDARTGGSVRRRTAGIRSCPVRRHPGGPEFTPRWTDSQPGCRLDDTLEGKQLAFDGQRGGPPAERGHAVPAERAVGGDDTMARDQQPHRVAADGPAHRPGRAGSSDPSRHLAIADGLARAGSRARLPGPADPRRAGRRCPPGARRGQPADRRASADGIRRPGRKPRCGPSGAVRRDMIPRRESPARNPSDVESSSTAATPCAVAATCTGPQAEATSMTVANA